MRKFRVHVDDSGYVVQEKGWFFWHTIIGNLPTKSQADSIIYQIKDQPK